MRLIYLSPVSWDSFSQRPHKFVGWFQQRYHGDVIWIDPYPTRLPRLGDMGRKRSIDRPAASSGQDSLPGWLRLHTPRALPFEPVPGSSTVNRALWRPLFAALQDFNAGDDCFIVVGKPSALALQVLARHPGSETLYDAMDDFPSFYEGLSKWSMLRKEGALAKRVHWISVSSTRLAQRLARYSDKLLVVHNACDADLPEPSFEHRTRADAKSPHVLGYIGTIGAWFDWDLVIRLAQANPTHKVRLIGPLYNLPQHALPGNIELLPACSHTDAIAHMRMFSVGLIPFKLTSLTASVDPIKYYEYRALGLPVISTPFGEMSLRGSESGVFLLDGTSNLGKIAGQAIAHVDDTSVVDRFRRKNTWESRFELAYGSLQGLTPSS